MLKTKKGLLIDIQPLSRNDLIEILTPINPTLAQLVQLQPDTGDIFYKVNYPFASPIIMNKECYLPLANGRSISFSDPQLPDELARDLAYEPADEDPLAFILSKTSEIYLQLRGRTISQAIIRPGSVFGATRATDKSNNLPTSALVRDLNAGAHSISMLHKIGDQVHHSKLQKKYGIKTMAPETLQDHLQVFADIAKNSNCDWRCEIIYFPRPWIRKLKTLEYAGIALCLMEAHRESYTILHNLGKIWDANFSEIEKKRDLNKYSQYSLSTAKHLFMVAAKSAIAYRPATSDEMAPISLIKEAYRTGYYGSRQKHSIIILEPTLFDIEDGSPVYYSINYPTLEQIKPDNASTKSNIALSEEIMHLVDILRNEILHNKDKVDINLYNLVKSIKFTLYHSDPKTHENTLPAELITEEDGRFGNNDDDGGKFNKDASFFKGCIKISRK